MENILKYLQDRKQKLFRVTDRESRIESLNLEQMIEDLLGVVEPTNLKDFCKGKYYSDERTPWEPFEGYLAEDLEVFVDNDVHALKGYLNIGGGVENDNK